MADRSAAVLKKIGENITRLREAQGLTVSELARRADMEKSNLSPIEKGKINVTVRTLVKIADGLGVGVAELVG